VRAAIITHFFVLFKSRPIFANNWLLFYSTSVKSTWKQAQPIEKRAKKNYVLSYHITASDKEQFLIQFLNPILAGTPVIYREE
jgi:hypothetical protein